MLRAIENRSAIETAKRIRQRISTIYAYAIASGLADSDPAEKVGAALKPLPKKGRQPAITDIAGLRGLLATVDKDFARPVTRLALRLIALTAVRPGELRGALWEEFENLNGDAPLWRILAAWGLRHGRCQRNYRVSSFTVAILSACERFALLPDGLVASMTMR